MPGERSRPPLRAYLRYAAGFGVAGGVVAGLTAWQQGRPDWFAVVVPVGALVAGFLGLVSALVMWEVLEAVVRMWPPKPPWREAQCVDQGCQGVCRSRMTVRRGGVKVLEAQVTCGHSWSLTASPGEWSSGGGS